MSTTNLPTGHPHYQQAHKLEAPEYLQRLQVGACQCGFCRIPLDR